MKSTCPLCDTTVEGEPSTGDWAWYACPVCGTFEIAGTDEAIVRSDKIQAQAHRDRFARERARGIKIHGVGTLRGS
jgi:hypothetical protein